MTSSTPRPLASSEGSIFMYAGCGLGLTAAGIVLVAMHRGDDGNDALLVVGYLLAGLGGLALQVAVIALGVAIGLRHGWHAGQSAGARQP